MSHNAMSMAAMAEVLMLFAVKKAPLSISCHNRSIWNGSRPIRNPLKCSTTPAIPSSRLERPASPTP